MVATVLSGFHRVLDYDNLIDRRCTFAKALFSLLCDGSETRQTRIVRASLTLHEALTLDLLDGIIAVGTFGARKYGAENWTRGIDDGVRRFYDAAERHLKRILFHGEEVDSESNLPHIYHAAWNILAAEEFSIREQEKEKADE